MSIHVIVDGNSLSRQCWDFTDGEYERALYMFEHLVYEGRTKGILLRDGKRNDEVWLKRIVPKKPNFRERTKNLFDIAKIKAQLSKGK